jgi:mono/diheme cytochrome c family protein
MSTSVRAVTCRRVKVPRGRAIIRAWRIANDLAGRLGQVVAATVVLNGRNGMPAFGHSQRRNASNATSEQAAASQLLSDEQIAEIVNYIRSHFGNHYPERITAAAVAALRHPSSTPAY